MNSIPKDRMQSNGMHKLIPSPVKLVGFANTSDTIVNKKVNSKKALFPTVVKTGKSPPPMLNRNSSTSSHPVNYLPRYFHIHLLKRPEGLGINMMAVKREEFEAIIIAGQREKEVSAWRMSNRELEERRKIQPGLEIVAINGKLLEPRTLSHAHNIVYSSDRDIDLTVRRLSEEESHRMMSLLQEMEDNGKVFVAKRPSQKNKSSRNSPSFHFRAIKKDQVVPRETFPYATPPRSRQDYLPSNSNNENNKNNISQEEFAERRRKAEKKGNKQTSKQKVDADDNNILFLNPTDALGVGIDLDVYIDKQMMINDQTKEFLEEQKNRTDAIANEYFKNKDTKIDDNDESSNEKKNDSPPPNPTNMRKSLIKLLATLKGHQANAREALVHIMSKEKILQKNLQVDKNTYKRLMEESEEYILEAAQAFVELPGLSQKEKTVVWEACYNMLLEAKECDSIKRNVLSTLDTIKDQVGTVRDALYLLASEEKIAREAKLIKVAKLCEHSLNCKSKTCKINGCSRMKSNIQHVKTCKIHKQVGQQCSLCLNMETLLKFINKKKDYNAIPEDNNNAKPINQAVGKKSSEDRLSTIAEVKSFDDLKIIESGLGE